jgi:hypothetical protein
MAKKPVDIDALVKESLVKIASAGGSLRLAGKGEDVVFAGAGGANKQAIALLKDPNLPLVVENGTGKTATVSLTLAGFERIADALFPEKLVDVVGGLSANLPPSARVMFLQDLVRKTPQAIAGLVPLLEAATAAEKLEAETRAREAEKQRAAEAASLAALERWKLVLQERRNQRIDSLKRELAAEAELPVISPAAKPATAESNSLPLPKSAEDVAFRRNVARRLVSSWVDAWDKNKPEARDLLESAIWNVSGFRQVGEASQRVSFDGRYHEGGAGLFTGDVVQVVRPGWILEEADDCEYVVLKALVTQS